MTTSTHGNPNSPPAKARGRVARTATDHGGTTPRPSSSPVAASSTGMELAYLGVLLALSAACLGGLVGRYRRVATA